MPFQPIISQLLSRFFFSQVQAGVTWWLVASGLLQLFSGAEVLARKGSLPRGMFICSSCFPFIWCLTHRLIACHWHSARALLASVCRGELPTRTPLRLAWKQMTRGCGSQKSEKRMSRKRDGGTERAWSAASSWSRRGSEGYPL